MNAANEFHFGDNRFIVLYCIVLYCIVLYCIVLYCIVLYCIVLYCIVWWKGIQTATNHMQGRHNVCTSGVRLYQGFI